MLAGLLFEVLASAAVSAILVAALAFLTRSWISERLKNAIKHEYDQKLESHKAELKAHGEVELERLRSQLAIQASERSIVFTKLHEQRASVIAATYSKLRALHTALGEYTKIFEPVGDRSKDERRSAAVEAHKAFVEFYPANRIFLPRPCVSKIDAINSIAVEVFNSFYYEVEMVGPQQSDSRKWLSLFERVKGEMESALSGLEDEFRRLLGDEG